MNVPDKLISSCSWEEINIYIYYKKSKNPPSVRDIANEFSIPQTSVFRKIKHLQKLGVFGTQSGTVNGTPKYLSNRASNTIGGTVNGTVVGTPKKTIEERKKEFVEKLKPYLEKYGKDTLNDFYQYWTQVNDGGSKMLFEMQKVFQIPNRLATWHKNNYGSKGNLPIGMKLQNSKNIDYGKGLERFNR